MSTTTWLKFTAYATLWLLGAGVYWLLFPCRIIQREFGSLADWAIEEMKECLR